MELKKKLDTIQADCSASAIHVSVLKMQINPSMRVGFSSVSLNPSKDQKLLLEKGTILWPRQKTRNMSMSELKDFLVMQLYPTWKRMLNRMSYEFVGYHQLLCH